MTSPTTMQNSQVQNTQKYSPLKEFWKSFKTKGCFGSKYLYSVINCSRFYWSLYRTVRPF